MSRALHESAVLDIAPANSDFLSEVLSGLSRTPPTLPCKFFYDARGAALFQKICEQSEYYITRTELLILNENRAEIASQLGDSIELIGLGTGAGTKTRILLEELKDPVAYVPVDISDKQLQKSTAAFRRLLPRLEILPVCADYLQPVLLPSPQRTPRRNVVYFPGSTIGNFEPADAAAFLRRIADLGGQRGALLIGVDLQKDRQTLERAYNDSAGVTAEFNLNLLVRANHELGADFDIAHWRHQAIYNSKEGRIEMYLISAIDQTVRVRDRQRSRREPGDVDLDPQGLTSREASHQFHFVAGEKIITEYSYKHSREGFIALAASAGFSFERFWTDDSQLFGLFYFTVKL